MTNELLLVLLGLAVLLLGVASEFTHPVDRVVRLIAAAIGVVVLISALVR